MENTKKETEKTNEKNENSFEKEINKSSEEKSKPLFEDLSGHKHDDESFKKLMNEQNNRKK